MITAITSSMLESTSTSDNDVMSIGASKLTRLEPTIKHLINETRLSRMEEHNL